MKNCIVKIIDNVFEKMTKVGYFKYPRPAEVWLVTRPAGGGGGGKEPP